MSAFKDFKNRHRGQACVIMCTGPSLKKYKDPEPDIVKIGVNSAIFGAHDLHYTFLQDPGHPSNPYSYVSQLANYDCYRPRIAKWYGVSLSPLLRRNAERAGAYAYEFSSNELVEIDGHRVEDPNSKPYFSSNLEETPPAAAGSVAFPALQFALWCGFSRIYLAGVDILDTRRFNDGDSGNDYARFHLPRWGQFKQWVQNAYDEVRIISLNPVGLRGMFEDMDQHPVEHIEVDPSPDHYRFHIFCPPNTILNAGMVHCAFTSKVEKFAPRLAAAGHEVYVYTHEKSKCDGCEIVPVVDDSVLMQAYGIPYIKHDEWKTKIHKCEIKDYCCQTYTANMIKEMRSRYQRRDFVLSFFGHAAAPVEQAYPDCIMCEPSVGYFRGFAPFRAYETYHLRSYVQGLEKSNIKNYHPVIRPGFVIDDWDYNEKHDGYWLFLGRLDRYKGAEIAIETAKRTGEKLVVAGQGDIKDVWPGELPENVEYVGYADAEMRRQLYAGAKSFFAPSKFQEPCGWTAIEAQLCGVPVVCTDVGGMVESVLQGITGFRCQTMYDFEAAVHRIDEIDRAVVRKWAVQNFNITRHMDCYFEWFDKLWGLFWGCDFNGRDLTKAGFLHGSMVYPK